MLFKDLLCKLPQLVSFDHLGGRGSFILLTDGEGPLEILLARDRAEATWAFTFLKI